MDKGNTESQGTSSIENVQYFEERKQDHIRLALDQKNQASGLSGLNRISLLHEALPELDFSEVCLKTQSLNQSLPTPFLVSSMTAGHREGVRLNQILAEACAERGWMMGVGSQRRQLIDREMDGEWRLVRQGAPGLILLGNIGLSQVVQASPSDIQRLVDSLEAGAMIVHTNPLQECLQREGTPHFKGGIEALDRLCAKLSVPVILKETGCGFSESTLRRLMNVGVRAVDVSGLGGTHWGRIEGGRSEVGSVKELAVQSFWNWGVSTVESLRAAVGLRPPFEIWASGGVRSGVDAAKLLAMGARVVGLAKPILAAACLGERQLRVEMEKIEFELKVAMFCTGCVGITGLQREGIWEWVQN